MIPKDFSERQRRYMSQSGSIWSYIPPPLPPELAWSDELVAAISVADRCLGQLAGMGRTLSNPHLLIRPFMRREAVLSSQIEGTQASESELVLFEINPSVEAHAPDVREVANYIRALEYGLDRIKTLPLSLRLIREMHRLLMTGVRGEEGTPGEFRRKRVWIGPRECKLEEATFVPPPPGNALSGCLDALEKFLHIPSSIPPVARMAMVHYQFEAIHPFVDGNGRIGRLLISLLLCLEGILPQPLLYLSAYFERNRSNYYDGLLRVSQAGDWIGWLKFFADGVASEAMDAVDRAQRLLRLRSTYVEELQKARTSALLIKLVDGLFDKPAMRLADVTSLLGVTVATAQKHVDRLVSLGMLKEITGYSRNRIYMARGVLDAIQEPSFGGSKAARGK